MHDHMELGIQYDRTSLREQVANYIIENIRNRVWLPGERLPSEKALCEMFGVSRNILREALRSLERMALVTTHGGKGTYVCSKAPDSFMQQMQALFVIEKIDLDQLYEFRICMETTAVRLGMARISDEEINVLQNDIDSMLLMSKRGNSDGFIAANVSFHLHLVKSSHNRYLEIMYTTARDLIRFGQSYVRLGKAAQLTSIKAHQEILDAIKLGDTELALQLVVEHIHEARSRHVSQNKI